MSLPLLHAGKSAPGLSAALDLRFALDKSLTAYRGPTPSFSRASTGSYFDGSGVLRYAALNTTLYSEDFSNAYWTKSNATISTNQTIAPDGKNTADLLYPSSTGAARGIYYASPSAKTISIYAKLSGKNWIALTDSSAATSAWFNLSSGTVGTVGAGYTAAIQNAGNGWYRCSLTKTTDFSYFQIYGTDSDNTLTATVNGTDGVFIWGAQAEASSTVGTYCPTTSSANSAPRFDHSFNGTSWVSRGLLVEEQRTNSLNYSEDFTNAIYVKNNATVLSNAGVAPDGTATADLIYPTASSSGVYYNSYSGTSQYSASVFAKASGKSFFYFFANDGLTLGASFNLSNGTVSNVLAGSSATITNVGNGWFRCTITSPSTALYLLWQVAFQDAQGSGTTVTPNGTDGILFWGAQRELGAFPTSYIPATSASTTRSADVCQITGSDFSGIWNNGEGSAAIEFDSLGATPSSDCYLFNASTSGSFTTMALWSYLSTTSNNVIHRLRVGGSDVFNTNIGSNYSPNMPAKTAMAFKSGDSSISFNGFTPVQNSSSFTLSGINTFYIGQSPTGSAVLNGHIARLRYYRKRLPNATLQLLSEPDPTLNLQFALNKTLTPVAGPAPSFSRASTGTYFNASGVLTSASINTPRFDHVYSGGQWVSRGLLIEEQRTNLIQYSEDISYSGWTKTDASVSVNSGIAPDGNMTADKLVENTASGIAHRMYYSLSMGTSSTFSAFFKAAGRNYVMMMIYAGSNAKLAYFDILNGSVVSTNTPQITAKVDPVGNGWFRCSVTYSGVDPSSFVQVHMSPNGITDTYNGDGTSGMFIWGLQAENNVSFPTSYIPTTSSSTTRSADVCQITGTSFNWMWNQGEGSLFFDADSFSTSTNNQFITSASSGASSNSINLVRSNANDVTGVGSSVLVGGVVQEVMNAAAGTWPTGSSCKLSFGYKANDFAQSINGTAVTTDTSGSIPTVSQMVIGDAGWTTGTLNGHIAKLIYYPARLTNTKLQQLST